MKLRLRLAITVLGVAIPVAAAIVWLHHRADVTAMRDGLTQLALGVMESGERARCEADPATWRIGPRRAFFDLRARRRGRRPGLGPGPRVGPGPGLPPPPRFLRGRGRGRPPGRPGGHPRGRHLVPFRPRLFAYDTSLVSKNPRAPTPAPALVRDLRAGHTPAAGWTEIRGFPVYEVLVPMSWRTGPCAVVLALAPRPRRHRPLLPPLTVWGLPTLAVLLAVLLAVGPVVRRIRRLTRAVAQSADAGWDGTIPVKGNDEIGELARAFEGAGREIRARMAAQLAREQTLRDFLANTTHDVMIPLTVLEGHLDALAAGTAGEKTIAAAAAEAQYIGALLHNLAAAAKLENGAPDVARLPLDLAEVVERVAARYRPVAKNAGVAFDHAGPGAPVPIVGDVTLVEQAASNLVYNAIRHNRPGGHAALTLDVGAGSTFVLRVVDDGPGLPADARERLFDRFARGDGARTRFPEGQGLGLHIAWRICERHGFTLRLADAEGGGLEATITGPLAGPEASDPPASDAPGSGPT